MNVILWDSESVWFNDWPYNKRRLQWPIFHGPVILIYYACHWSHDLTFLYFHSETLQFYWQSAIQAFYSVLREILLRHRSSLRCWHLGHGLKVKEWPILHGPVILPNMLKTLMDEWHTWGNHKDWSHKVYIGQWFHGPVIFNVSNLVLEMLSLSHIHLTLYIDQWPIYNSPVILTYTEEYLMDECHIYVVV